MKKIHQVSCEQVRKLFRRQRFKEIIVVRLPRSNLWYFLGAQSLISRERKMRFCYAENLNKVWVRSKSVLVRFFQFCFANCHERRVCFLQFQQFVVVCLWVKWMANWILVVFRVHVVCIYLFIIEHFVIVSWAFFDSRNNFSSHAEQFELHKLFT